MENKEVKPLREMVRLVRPHKHVLFGVLVCLAILACFNLAIPRLLGFVVDNVFFAQEVTSADEEVAGLSILPYVLVIVFLVYGMRNLLFYLAKTRVMVVGERVAFEMRQRLIAHLHALSVDFFQ